MIFKIHNDFGKSRMGDEQNADNTMSSGQNTKRQKISFTEASVRSIFYRTNADDMS